MMVQTQTTIRILTNLEAGSGLGSIVSRHEATAGFAVFCEDRR
jgi:hypothetical protein